MSLVVFSFVYIEWLYGHAARCQEQYAPQCASVVGSFPASQLECRYSSLDATEYNQSGGNITVNVATR